MAEALIEDQNRLFGYIGRAVENYHKLSPDLKTKSAVKARLDRLMSNWTKFENNDSALYSSKLSEAQKKNDYFVDDLFGTCEESFLQAKAFFDELLAESEAHSTRGTSQETSGRSKPLPKINLPRFGGNYNEWVSFRDLFTSLIVNEDITAVEKLQYLKMSLFGDAAKLIANIPVTGDNFDRAWGVIQARFDNKRALVNTQFDLLFGLKPLQRKNGRDLEALRSTVSHTLEALQALGSPIQHWDAFLVYFVGRLLDPETLEAWELHLGSNTEPPPYKDLNNFLEGRVRALENVDGRMGQSPQSSAFNRQGKNTSFNHSSGRSSLGNATNSSTSLNASASASSCPCCRTGQHYIAACPSYRAKTPEQRRELISAKRLCLNCLGPHRTNSCRSTRRCQSCNELHHTSLHPRPVSTPFETSQAGPSQQSGPHPTAAGSTSIQANAPPGPKNQQVQATATANHASIEQAATNGSQSLLATALVTIIAPCGQEVQARALLDQGSELSFACETLVQMLRLPRRQSTISLYGIGAQKTTVTRGAVTLHFRHHRDPGPEFSTEAHVLTRVTGRIPAVPVNVENCSHLVGLDFADPTFATPGAVDLILGADVYGQLLNEEVRKSSPQCPVAQSTHLGWIVSGPVSILIRDRTPPQRAHFCSIDNELHDLVHKFWAQEDVGSTSQIQLTEEEKECESHFVTTHSRDDSGRYIVRLPFKKPPNLGDSRQTALRMWKNMQSRFSRDPEFHRLYNAVLEEYEELNHMKPVEESASVNGTFYLPHHGVSKTTSTTTKLRVVFNGSAKTDSGESLNDTLHAGPKVQTDLVDVIMRWRLHAFVFSADVEKMYRQVLLHPADRGYQRLLWSKDLQKPPSTYELNTVTFGLTCAPFQANRVVRQLAIDEGRRFPLAANVIPEDFYVDDCLSGAESIEAAREKASQVDKLLSAGGFRLQKWATNCEEVLGGIEESRCQNISKKFEEGPMLRALGISWNPVTDAFVLAAHQDAVATPPLTKRAILSTVAKLFDPLGWLAPIVIVAKTFLQSLWRTPLGWDDELPDNLAAEWMGFSGFLTSTLSFSIPRWIQTTPASVVELHGFSDASESALAAVVYLRVLKENLEASTSLIMAKTKVTPLKCVTIARLELSAAVLLVQLVQRCQSALHLSDVPVHLWTDSSVALTWISGHPSRWKDFVRNRVSFIQETAPRARWHHVPGNQNPADVASRGTSPQQLLQHPLWWGGPDWLSFPSPSWPSRPPNLPADVNLEERPSVVHLTTAEPTPMWNLVERYSTLDRLLRVTARLFRAADAFRKIKSESSPILRPEEIEKALLFWVRTTQASHFAEEIKTLERNETLPRSNRLIRLTPFVDKKDGLLRVGGRLRQTNLEYDFKHPLVLPRKSALTSLVIDDAHRRTLHGGVQLVLSTLRRKFWVIGGRAPVRSFILRCVPCTYAPARCPGKPDDGTVADHENKSL